MPTDAATFEIPSARLADATSRVEAYARKAVKLGLNAPYLRTTREYDRTWLMHRSGSLVAGPFDGFAPLLNDGDLFARSMYRVVVPMTDVEITGARPIIAGWEFVATIEHTDAGGNFIWSVPGAGNLPSEYRDASSTYCDACKLHRMRTKTYIIKSTTAAEPTYQRVGSSCLQDFLGDASPAAWMRAFTLLRELEALSVGEDYGEAFNRSAEEVGVSVFLACVSMLARDVGYVSAKQADELNHATGTAAFSFCTNERLRKQAFAAMTSRDFDRANAALVWLIEQDDSGNDYMHNLKLAAKMSVTPRTCRLLSSLMPAFDRELGRRAAKAAKVDEYFDAPIASRPVVDLTLERTGGYSNDFGYTHVLTFGDAAGHTFVWKTTTPYTTDDTNAEIGSTYRVCGRVEEHSTYRGAKQTRLSRCSLYPAGSDDKKLATAMRKFCKAQGIDAPEWAWTASQKKRAAKAAA